MRNPAGHVMVLKLYFNTTQHVTVMSTSKCGLIWLSFHLQSLDRRQLCFSSYGFLSPMIQVSRYWNLISSLQAACSSPEFETGFSAKSCLQVYLLYIRGCFFFQLQRFSTSRYLCWIVCVNVFNRKQQCLKFVEEQMEYISNVLYSDTFVTGASPQNFTILSVAI